MLGPKFANFTKIPFSFENTYLKPQGSSIASRSEVQIASKIGSAVLSLPVISANMKTITNWEFAHKIALHGAHAGLHRFNTIEESVNEFNQCYSASTWVSLGVSLEDHKRAEALKAVGATNFIVDVAHGAQDQVAAFYSKLRTSLGNNVNIIVGNFGPAESIRWFESKITCAIKPDAYKIGIGPGQQCITKNVAGVHSPTLYYTKECVDAGYNVVSDGGIKEARHFVMCLAMGAKAVMIGSYFASCIDIAAEKKTTEVISSSRQMFYGMYGIEYVEIPGIGITHNIISGSASQESYVASGKQSLHRAPEGITSEVAITKDLSELMLNLEGGLRSAMSYSNSKTLKEFKENAEFIIT